MDLDLEKIRDELEVLLRKVGKIVSVGFDDEHKNIMTKSNPSDFVTEYDIRVNRLIVEYLNNKYPDFSIVSEEEKPICTNSDYKFHIDPIDGTNNFIRGIPIFFSGISLSKNDEVILSTTYNPVTDDFFSAIKGMGAYHNGSQIFVGDRNIAKADIVLRARPKEIQKKLIGQVINYIDQVKNPFCCHYELSGVASNRFDAFISTIDENTWDMVPYLLIKEAGGKVTDWSGDEFNLSKKTILASNGIIHDELIKITKEFV